MHYLPDKKAYIAMYLAMNLIDFLGLLSGP